VRWRAPERWGVRIVQTEVSRPAQQGKALGRDALPPEGGGTLLPRCTMRLQGAPTLLPYAPLPIRHLGRTLGRAASQPPWLPQNAGAKILRVNEVSQL
jgi:hypothetical protein